MKKIINVIIIVLLLISVFILQIYVSKTDPYIEIVQDDYKLFVLPNDVDIFNLTNDDLEFYWINTNDIDRHVVKLYESNLVITTIDNGLTINLYNQNGFYYILVSK